MFCKGFPIFHFIFLYQWHSHYWPFFYHSLHFSTFCFLIGIYGACGPTL
jgi:hypothetical protein